MKIAVLGAGAMGSLFGARLAAAGNDPYLIDVDAELIAQVRRHGLRIDDDRGSHRLSVPIGLASDFHEPVELLIVFTKGPQTEPALDSVRHLLGCDSWVMTLQNGLGNGERIARTHAPARILIGMTNWPADLRAPGHVSTHGSGAVRLWSFDGQVHPEIERVCRTLSAADLHCSADPQVLRAIWEKVAFNAAMNSIAAITGCNVGAMADDPDLERLIWTVVDEVLAVARSGGHEIEAARVSDSVRQALSGHRAHKPSMLRDLEAGRGTEIETINGAVVAQGRATGTPAPVTEALLRLVRARERQVSGLRRN